MSVRTRRSRTLLLAVVSLSVPACAPVLEPSGPDAERVARLGWIMIVTASVVTAAVFVLLLAGLVRRRRGDDPDDPDEVADDRRPERWVIAGGVVLPVVVLVPIAGLTVSILDDPPESALQVEVIGHQYWWEYRYPDGAVTANELHLPVDQPVELTMTSDDVIHSLWVPALGGKHDLVPGHETTMTLEADEVGRFEGKCAEYCGLQHAKMLLEVVVQSEADFDEWLGRQRRPAVGDVSSEGARLFDEVGCASCHAVRGTPADGRLGPDLTHLAERRTLGAGVLRNDPEGLRRWIDETWEVKSGITMPPLPLTDREVDEIATYLESLR